MYEYPFGNGQQLNLDWFLAEWKNLLAAWEAEKNGIAGALDAEIAKAEAALADVFAARDAAAQSAANALESKNAAAQSASDASGYLATVHADANTASDAARNAAQSESNAAESAQTALASKNNAANSERNAAQSEANANSSKNAAAQSASDADASKRAAAQSAADANASKSAAAQSAEDAEDAATSVEASAEQIATNKNDINSFKETIIEQSKNILPIQTIGNVDVRGITAKYENGVITVNGENASSSGGRATQLTTPFILEAGTYVMSIKSTNFTAVFLEQDVTNVIIAQTGLSNPYVFTLSETTNCYIGVNVETDRSYNEEIEVQLEKGDTAHAILKPSQYSAIDFFARYEIEKLQAIVLENIGG